MTQARPRILVLGGNRFAGWRFVEMLRDIDATVVTFHRSARGVSGVPVLRGNRNVASDLSRAVARRFDVVVDLCLYTGQQAALIVTLLRGRPCRYIAVSSAVVYSCCEKMPWVEETPLRAGAVWGDYGRKKMEADLALNVGKLPDALILRPTYYVGPEDPAGRCQFAFERAAHQLPVPVPGDGSAPIQILDVDDMAAVLLEATFGQQRGIVNVGGSRAITVADFAAMCAREVTYAPKIELLGEIAGDELEKNEWPFPNAPLCVSDARFRDVFRHRCRSAEDAVKHARRAWV